MVKSISYPASIVFIVWVMNFDCGFVIMPCIIV